MLVSNDQYMRSTLSPDLPYRRNVLGSCERRMWSENVTSLSQGFRTT